MSLRRPEYRVRPRVTTKCSNQNEVQASCKTSLDSLPTSVIPRKLSLLLAVGWRRWQVQVGQDQADVLLAALDVRWELERLI